METTELTAEQWNAETHNGCVTIHNPGTGNHRTFQIRTQSEDSSFAPGMRIVALLTGPDNESDYQPFAFATQDRGVIVWRSKRGEGKPSQYDKFARLLNDPVKAQERWGLEYQIEGACRRCNRKLTRPDSISSGIGPTCEEKEMS